MSTRSVDDLLVLWASEKLSLFLIFQRSGKYGGANVCVIEDLSDQECGYRGPVKLNYIAAESSSFLLKVPRKQSRKLIVLFWLLFQISLIPTSRLSELHFLLAKYIGSS